jgi:hypothetical protein
LTPDIPYRGSHHRFAVATWSDALTVNTMIFPVCWRRQSGGTEVSQELDGTLEINGRIRPAGSRNEGQRIRQEKMDGKELSRNRRYVSAA